MAQISIHHSATALIKELMRLNPDDTSAIVITTESRTGTLLGRFIDKAMLNNLNVYRLGSVLDHIEVFVFGVDEVPMDSHILMDVMPVRTDAIMNKPVDRKRREYNLSYFLRVRIISPSATLISKAG